jgi:hypothetical protein
LKLLSVLGPQSFHHDGVLYLENIFIQPRPLVRNVLDAHTHLPCKNYTCITGLRYQSAVERVGEEWGG